MVFKSDKQRKFVMAKLKSGSRSNISPRIVKKTSIINERKGKILARDFIIKNPRASKDKVIKFLKSKGIVIKGNPNGIARFIGSFKEKIKRLNIPRKAGKVKTFLQKVGTEVADVQLEFERSRERRFQRRLKETEIKRQEILLQQEREKLRLLQQR